MLPRSCTILSISSAFKSRFASRATYLTCSSVSFKSVSWFRNVPDVYVGLAILSPALLLFANLHHKRSTSRLANDVVVASDAKPAASPQVMHFGAVWRPDRCAGARDRQSHPLRPMALPARAGHQTPSAGQSRPA